MKFKFSSIFSFPLTQPSPFGEGFEQSKSTAFALRIGIEHSGLPNKHQTKQKF